ncbi:MULTISPECIES: biotin/lipoyl-containing protein [unclassified Arthrobacter]|uniref:biotin/lipoyl-containing protein n=1 Tax=unclassified Arthrobacter TaxID=235627 RepID=UPI001304CEAD|nr:MULTISPECIES: lipoyl domain-containing protein [unclassified Arthrobacter]
MNRVLKLELSDGLKEAKIIAWRVRAGDVVGQNDVISDICTAETLFELRSPFDGVIVDLHHSAGSSVAAGSVIASFAATPSVWFDEGLPYGAPPETYTPPMRL